MPRRRLGPSHHSPLTTLHSPLTTHHSPLTTHHSPLTTHHSPLTTHHSPNPPPPFLDHNRPHGINPGGLIIQARALVQDLAAGFAEDGRGLVSNLVECLQAIGREARRNDQNALDAAL